MSKERTSHSVPLPEVERPVLVPVPLPTWAGVAIGPAARARRRLCFFARTGPTCLASQRARALRGGRVYLPRGQATRTLPPRRRFARFFLCLAAASARWGTGEDAATEAASTPARPATAI